MLESESMKQHTYQGQLYPNLKTICNKLNINASTVYTYAHKHNLTSQEILTKFENQQNEFKNKKIVIVPQFDKAYYLDMNTHEVFYKKGKKGLFFQKLKKAAPRSSLRSHKAYLIYGHYFSITDFLDLIQYPSIFSGDLVTISQLNTAFHKIYHGKQRSILLHLFKNKVPLHRRFDKKHLITGYYKNDIDHFIINHSPNNKIITNKGRKLKSIPKNRSVTICGITYKSLNDYAKQNNLTKTAANNRWLRYDHDDPKMLQPMRIRSTNVTICNVTYKTLKEAANAHNVNYRTFCNRIKKLGYDDPYVFAPTSLNGKHIYLAGSYYASYNEAARMHNLTSSSLWRHIKKLGPRDPRIFWQDISHIK